MTWRFYADGPSPAEIVRPPLLGETDEPAGDCCSSIFLCPRCGTLWARIEVEGARTFATLRLCEPCGDGRLLTDFELHALAAGRNWDIYPPAMLQREIRLLLKETQDGRSDTEQESGACK